MNEFLIALANASMFAGGAGSLRQSPFAIPSSVGGTSEPLA